MSKLNMLCFFCKHLALPLLSINEYSQFYTIIHHLAFNSVNEGAGHHFIIPSKNMKSHA